MGRHSASSSCLVVLICLTLVPPALLFGQAYFGTVSGELTDATGAVVQGVTVVLSDQQKGFMFNTTSDSSGRYLFRSIPPGVYTVSAEAKGFDRAHSASVKVDINQNVTANLNLKVAGTSQTVQVEAQPQAIQTEDAETGQVVNRRFINNLPLIDRNVIALTSLAPGVTEMDEQCDATCTGTNFVGNAPRALGSVGSPWSFTANLSLGKQFSIREAMNLEFRIEAQNAFNHPVFATPDTSVDDENFGKITSTAVGPREVQLAVKFNF